MRRDSNLQYGIEGVEMMWLPEKRYEQILSILEKEGAVKASSLKVTIGVSSETVRRDLEYLESEGYLKRTHGGAVAVNQSDSNESNNGYLEFQKRERQKVSEKAEIAEIAAQYITEGQSLALDSGTTSRKLAEIIKTKFSRLTVVTNSLHIANVLADAKGFTVILTGGVLSPEEYSMTTDMATLIFSKLNINTFFLTTCGVSVESGITYQRPDEIIVQIKMMEASDKTIIITDSSKLGVNSLYKMCGLEKINMIITDSSVTDQQVKMFEKANVPVVSKLKQDDEDRGH
ncbi:DeoR/GlpR family DNA-binding transcription regulator [Acidaminobacter sp.]|uniref:DeoR/GlpR family DNA-binding transcription regulator n=1 Tax=Acidaminobacter sp. TaxID=1872102 RepID=UPI002562F713|nr:DeoR/GlpR family DNA-binding transcription regulator [Acidaminobacter sp.]MDK9710339.1 DeoR/GlpR family DNA-binding transcription regulator [Acidaminobacter sp.]